MKENNEEKRNEHAVGDSGMIVGRNPVLEALKAGRPIDKILLSSEGNDYQIKKITAMAREKGIVVRFISREELTKIADTKFHQGVLAYAAQKEYCEVSDILKAAKEKGEDPFIIIADEINDPHNLGAIIRTAECCGAHGVIIPKRRNVGVNMTVAKTSAGAIEHMNIAKVTNLSQTIDELKAQNIWIYGADGEGENSLFETAFSGGVAIVVGSEGYGLSRLVKEKCDFVLKIPMFGQINSLNASVAGAIIMYEVVRKKQNF